MKILELILNLVRYAIGTKNKINAIWSKHVMIMYLNKIMGQKQLEKLLHMVLSQKNNKKFQKYIVVVFFRQ